MNEPVPLAVPPDPDGPMPEIELFALTYNAYARLCSEDLPRLVSPVLRSLAKHGQPPRWAGVDLLRGTLFFLQRQTHHWGEIPTEQERQMRTLVAAINERHNAVMMVADPCI